MMNSLTRSFSWIVSHWRTGAVIAGAVGIAVTFRWCLEGDEARAQRAERNRKKELRTLADTIARYGRKVHQRYPTGDVVVSEWDLAEQLRKRPDIIATALHILLGEQKVQKAPLSGYWKLKTGSTPGDSPPETFT
jgi:hypothetical protein